MEQLVIDYQNLEELFELFVSFAIGFISFACGLQAYIKKKGIKLATFDKVEEYRELKEVAGILSNNISKKEFLTIVSTVVEMKKSKKTITVEDVAMIGNMLVDAVTTEEKK